MEGEDITHLEEGIVGQDRNPLDVVVVRIPGRPIPDVMNVVLGHLCETQGGTREDQSPLHEEDVVRNHLIATNDAIAMNGSRHEMKKEGDLFPDPQLIIDNVNRGLLLLVHLEARDTIIIPDPPSIDS